MIPCSWRDFFLVTLFERPLIVSVKNFSRASITRVSQLDWNPNWNRSKLESDWNLVGRTPQILARSNWNSWNIGILESNLDFGIRIPIWTSESNFQADRTTFKARHPRA